MDWIQVITIIGTLSAFMMWMKNDLALMKNDLKQDISRLDVDMKIVDGKIEVAHRRMDKLYQVIIDLLKQRK